MAPSTAPAQDLGPSSRDEKKRLDNERSTLRAKAQGLSKTDLVELYVTDMMSSRQREANIQQQLKDTQQKLDALSQEMDRKVAGLERKIAKQQQTIEELQQTIAKQQQTISKQQQTIKELQQTIAEQQQTIVDLRGASVSQSTPPQSPAQRVGFRRSMTPQHPTNVRFLQADQAEGEKDV